MSSVIKLSFQSRVAVYRLRVNLRLFLYLSAVRMNIEIAKRDGLVDCFQN